MTRRRGQGEGAIYRRSSDGKWVGVLDLGWVGGKRRRRTVYGGTRAEAGRKLSELKKQHEHGVDLLQRPRTVGEWLDEWLRDVKAHDGIRGTSITRYRSIVEAHLKPELGRIRLDKLSPRDVQVFLAGRTKVVAPQSVVKIHAVLRVALSDAERFELVSRNVAKAVKPPRVPRAERRYLTLEEARHFLRVVRGDRLEAVFVLGLTMGLRRGETLGLRWADISMDNRMLTINRALQRFEGQLHLVEPKTRLSQRPLPIPSVALRALERQRESQERERGQAGPRWNNEHGLVFTSSIGTPMEPRNVEHAFHELRQQAGLEWLRMHDLRHGCATFLLGSDVEPRTVMEILGHSTFRLTMDLYGHALSDRLRAAMDVMDKSLDEEDDE
jgi:integrase